ncbi:hypothetical protein [Burkholderia sp. Ac-20392]|uniref:hypothetical protein n=1 Tax=Burkholderia sp. Ac-20392 TaxID=2703905 RepID=UPI0019812081|nr:hypothetical protein [Burkholderia sp. Ac-20392]MBN3801314.1 hypothetical protein [Burkholderia sp. Ac-20392]
MTDLAFLAAHAAARLGADDVHCSAVASGAPIGIASFWACVFSTVYIPVVTVPIKSQTTNRLPLFCIKTTRLSL